MGWASWLIPALDPPPLPMAAGINFPHWPWWEHSLISLEHGQGFLQVWEQGFNPIASPTVLWGHTPPLLVRPSTSCSMAWKESTFLQWAKPPHASSLCTHGPFSLGRPSLWGELWIVVCAVTPSTAHFHQSAPEQRCFLEVNLHHSAEWPLAGSHEDFWDYHRKGHKKFRWRQWLTLSESWNLVTSPRYLAFVTSICFPTNPDFSPEQALWWASEGPVVCLTKDL